MKGYEVSAVKWIMEDPVRCSSLGAGLKLRSYQEEVARAVADSVVSRRGLTFVVIFPRQSGKNELQAQIETYLLILFSGRDAEMVKVSPTWKPQSLNAMRRLQRVMKKNMISRMLDWKKENGYIFRVGTARIFFLSASPTANVVGATASTLLECDEAQDVLISKWDKEIAPMAASTNATRVFWGTAWTSQTLLAREKRAALEAEQKDGIRRVFQLTADDVAAEVPEYGKFVAGEIARHGRNNPYVRTQYYGEEIDAESGMFPPARRSRMRGSHKPHPGPLPGRVYAFLLDVAGEDENRDAEARQAASPVEAGGRDATALTIVEVDLTGLADPLVNAPAYRVGTRFHWTGQAHTSLFAQLNQLGQAWKPQKWVVDATGVGAGLASFLAKSFPGRVIPFVFSATSKSKLGWDFLTVVETGRFQDYASPPGPVTPPGSPGALGALFWREVEHCRLEALPGPGRKIRWGVPDGTRDPATGEPVHDDLLISAALCAVLDPLPWGLGESEVIPPSDPLNHLQF